MCKEVYLNMTSYSLIIPQWLVKATQILRIVPKSLNKLYGGVVSDVWCVRDTQKKSYVIRRTNVRHDNAFQIVQMLNMLPETSYIPSDFFAYAESTTSYITCYTWIDGIVLETFNDVMCNVVKICNKIHSIHVGRRAPSVYLDIHAEAMTILQNKDKLDAFGKKDTEDILFAATQVLNNLEPCDLSKILDNRGCLTHGDIKPRNTIRIKDSIFLIDWDKICSLSPEADLVYAFFSCNSMEVDYPMVHDLIWKAASDKYILDIALKTIHHIYLVHDVFVLVSTKTRLSYVKHSVLPQWRRWQYIRNEAKIQ